MSYQGIISALLGPTNTGKTHQALDTMLSYNSGMIGFPLRLLARENYEKLVRLRGQHAVALITGEEKIVSRNAQYYLCTVESMPLDLSVEFLAIDEIQLAGDPERGHIFTDRLLYARGLEETMFMGSEIARPLIERLVPHIKIISKPRFSALSYSRPRKLSRIPKRSAVVAFSASDVYKTADNLRRYRGGAAVVLGALSPRTRNAQVELYQSGEVDYVVATDAIGMGLNMDLEHVSFAKLNKFDGRNTRSLFASEVGQIAGRAGRYTRDGTFNTIAELGEMPPELVDAVENHHYAPLERFFWRNPALDFHSIYRLQKSLDVIPPRPELAKGREADDQRTLNALAQDPQIRALTLGPASVRLFWEICQIPDFHNTMTNSHIKLIKEIFTQLMGRKEQLDDDWTARQIERLNNLNSDIDTLINRLSNIRTWTYISHRAHWLKRAHYWQERSRKIEERLSDRLHECLTQQFVDKRAAVLVRSKGMQVSTEITPSGAVYTAGQYVGLLSGLSFEPVDALKNQEARTMLSSATQALKHVFGSHIAQMQDLNQKKRYRLDNKGRLLWDGVEIGHIYKGISLLKPRFKLLKSDLLSDAQRIRLQKYCEDWILQHIKARLQSFCQFEKDLEKFPAASRGIAFGLYSSFGILSRTQVTFTITPEIRKALPQVNFGHHYLWLDATAKPKTRELRALLWKLYHNIEDVPLPNTDACFVLKGEEMVLNALGFVRLKPKMPFIRVDLFERLSALAYKLSQGHSFSKPARITPEMTGLCGHNTSVLEGALCALGYQISPHDTPLTFWYKPKKPQKIRNKKAIGQGKAFEALHLLKRENG